MLDLLDRLFTNLVPQLEAVGLTREQISRGTEDLKLGAVQLALEVAQAEARGHRFTRAVRDPESYPRLVQAHNSVQDVLSLEMPRDLVAVLPRLHTLSESLPLDELQQDLGRTAASGKGLSGALARFLLFELVRLGVLVSTWRTSPHLHRVGIDDEVWDRRAEENLHTLLAHPEDLQGKDGVRPFGVILATTLYDILEHLDEATRAYSRISDELSTQYEWRALVEEALMDAPARDAVLVRNALGRAWGQQRTEVPRVIAQHPLLFEGTNRGAVDQLVSRRTRALAAEGLSAMPVRSHPALIDVIFTEPGEVAR